MKEIVHADTMRFWGDSHLACKKKELDAAEGWVSNRWAGPVDNRVTCSACIRVIKQRARHEAQRPSERKR